MNKCKVKFAIYGCGLIANVHAGALLGLEEAELVGCADKNPAAAVKFAQTYGIGVNFCICFFAYEHQYRHTAFCEFLEK